jgi:hypothetical protein
MPDRTCAITFSLAIAIPPCGGANVMHVSIIHLGRNGFNWQAIDESGLEVDDT